MEIHHNLENVKQSILVDRNCHKYDFNRKISHYKFIMLGVIGGVAILAVLVSVMALIIVRQNSKSRTRNASNSGTVHETYKERLLS